MNLNKSVVVIEDDRDLCQAISSLVKQHQFKFYYDLPDIKEITEQQPGLILVDENLPNGSGLSFVREYRASHSHTPILFITAQSTKELVLQCLNYGVNQFLEKPFTLDTLGKKICQMLQRDDFICLDDQHVLRLDRKCLERSGEIVSLTPIEYQIIEFLVLQKGHSTSREDMIQKIWGGRTISKNALDTHLSNLKKKCKISAQRIKNLRNRGYYWDSE